MYIIIFVIPFSIYLISMANWIWRCFSMVSILQSIHIHTLLYNVNMYWWYYDLFPEFQKNNYCGYCLPTFHHSYYCNPLEDTMSMRS